MGEKNSRTRIKSQHFDMRYGINIITGDEVWVNGPYPTGVYSDINFFRDSLINFLGPGERVEVDNEYIGKAPRYIKCPMSLTNLRARKVIQRRLRYRQETVNIRFKDWGFLKQVFRHHTFNHADILHDIMVLTQIVIDDGEKYLVTNIVMIDCLIALLCAFPLRVVHLLMGNCNLILKYLNIFI